jgi:transcriptional regulator with XRE-family HTH domain
MSLTPAQCKAARELLKWSLLDLGYRARISEKTVSRFETTHHVTRPDNIEAMCRAFEAAGVVFGDDGERVARRGKP